MYLLIIFKTLAAVGVFLLSIIAGFLRLKVVKSTAPLFHLGDSFASGVFLSAALLHLLPEADSGFRHLLGGYSYPLAQLIGIAIFILLLVMERGIFTFNNCNCDCHTSYLVDNKKTTPFFLIMLLTVHSLVEGAAIGISASLAEASILFFAIIAHKGSESFALTVKLHRCDVPMKNIRHIITLFSLITPFGIFIASLVTQVLQTNSGNLFGSVFNAIAAGTFLYLGVESLVKEKKPFENLAEIMALIFGVVLMALVAIWV
jgi:solute carrier family 39 (zinc transporter), member 1/2/3